MVLQAFAERYVLPMRGGLNIVAVAAIIALGAMVSAAPPALSEVRAGPSVMTFDDEFDGPRAAPPDASRWGYDLGGGGWGNDELQRYTDSTRNAALDGRGHLAITARRTATGGYTSARLVTRGKFTQTYGHFEARMRLVEGQGLWPAFWLLGANCDEGTPYPDCGEIDVMENTGNNVRRIRTHAHGAGDMDFSVSPHVLPGNGGVNWHVYAVDWNPSSVSWLIDGNVVQTMTRQQAARGWSFDHRFYVIVNLAVGGELAGPPDSSTRFPASILVDYVRVNE